MTVPDTPGERRRSRRSTDPTSLPPGMVERRTPTEIVGVLGVGVAVLTVPRALAQVTSMIERGAVGTVAFANANLLNLAADRADVRDTLRATTLILSDGVGVAWAAKTKGHPLPANLNGTDFTPLLLERAAARGWRVAMLGARPGVAQQAGAALGDRFPGLNICHVHHGFFDDSESDQICTQINTSDAQVLLVAMGNPRQELWLQQHLPETGANVGLAVGAFFDFAAGQVPRAPRWMRALRLEWLFRLLLEPRRLFARYVIGIPRFRKRVRRDVLDPVKTHLSRRAEDSHGGD